MYEATPLTETSTVAPSSATSWQDRVSQFNSFQQKTAGAVTAMGRVVYEAKQDLIAQDYKRFVAEANLKDSTERKYQCIGQFADIFQRHLDCLPATWTNLYQLTKVDQAKLEDALAQNRVWPQMTGKEIQALLQSLGVKCSNRNKKPNPKLSIKFIGTPTPHEIHLLEEAINACIAQHAIPAEVVVTSSEDDAEADDQKEDKDSEASPAASA